MSKLNVCVITTWGDDCGIFPTVFVHEQNEALSDVCIIKCLLPTCHLDHRTLFFSCKVLQLEKYTLYVGRLGWLTWLMVIFSRIIGLLSRKYFYRKSSLVEMVISLSLLPLTFNLWKLAYSRTREPELIHAHAGILGGWLATKLSNKFRIPVVLTEHSSTLASRSLSVFGQLLERESLIKATHVLAVSDYQLNIIINWGINIEKLFVLPNFVDDSFFYPTAARTVLPIILTISNLSENKNIPLLLQAFSLLISSGVHAKLVIGGDGRLRKHLENLSRNLNLGPDICHFTGTLSRFQVRDLMRQCSVFALCSKSETFGCVVAEAQACGKPIVSTACGGPETIITPATGLVVDDFDDASKFADALNLVITGKKQFSCDEIRKKTCERFGKKPFLANTLRVYNLAIEKFRSIVK